MMLGLQPYKQHLFLSVLSLKQNPAFTHMCTQRGTHRVMHTHRNTNISNYLTHRQDIDNILKRVEEGGQRQFTFNATEKLLRKS